mgnify:CR=1 FL=1
MRYFFKSVFLFLISSSCSWGQIIQFADLELNRYLINEKCVDTAQNGISFSKAVTVALNGDNEIQQSEALAVKALQIRDFPDDYSIVSILDLNAFTKLQYLKVIDIDDLQEITALNLDSLKTLWISDAINLRKVDISNLPNLTTAIRIEGITTLDTLNTRNGTSAQQFSLFYTQNVQYAFIDSLPRVINEFHVAGAMLVGATPSFDCSPLHTAKLPPTQPLIQVGPIPADRSITLHTTAPSIAVRILTTTGKVLIQTNQTTIAVTLLPAGVYLLQCQIDQQLITQKIVLH